MVRPKNIGPRPPISALEIFKTRGERAFGLPSLGEAAELDPEIAALLQEGWALGQPLLTPFFRLLTRVRIPDWRRVLASRTHGL